MHRFLKKTIFLVYPANGLNERRNHIVHRDRPKSQSQDPVQRCMLKNQTDFGHLTEIHLIHAQSAAVTGELKKTSFTLI